MSDTREKLIELIASKACYDYSPNCDEWQPHDCGKCYAGNNKISDIADHLIANGVRLETKTSDEKTSEWIPVSERLP